MATACRLARDATETQDTCRVPVPTLRAPHIELDGAVLGLALAVSLVTAHAFGAIPLAAAGLMIDSLCLLRRIGSGFDEGNVLVFGVDLPPARYLDARLAAGYPFPAATAKAALFLSMTS